MTDDSDACLTVRGVSKKFARSLKRSFLYGAEEIARAATGRKQSQELRPSEFWALRNISFNLDRGASIGIVGLNGSGKTTLLRIIAGIIRPTSGQVTVRGRIAPMLALGAGFKPALSGRENIFLNMSILGVSYPDIRKRFDDIVEFAELESAIGAPLGTYSTGMQMRLGFACAIHTNPEILIVDEVLAVGDARFRMKCRNKLNELRRAGTAMLLVSHSSISVDALTDQCLYLVKGQTTAFGPSSEVLKAYEGDTIRGAVKANTSKTSGNVIALPARDELKQVSISSVRIEMPHAEESGYWRSGEAGLLTINVSVSRPTEDLGFALIFSDTSGGAPTNVLHMTSDEDIGRFSVEREATFHLKFAPVIFSAGTYKLKVAVTQGDLQDLRDLVDNIKLVVVDTGKSRHSNFYQPRDWEIKGATTVERNDFLDNVDVEGAESF